MGVDRTWETGELTWPGSFFVEDFLAAMTEAFRYIADTGKRSATIDGRPTSKSAGRCYRHTMASPVRALRPVRSMAILLTGVLVAALLLVTPSAEALTRP